jgi:hypothetical protein
MILHVPDVLCDLFGFAKGLLAMLACRRSIAELLFERCLCAASHLVSRSPSSLFEIFVCFYLAFEKSIGPT